MNHNMLRPFIVKVSVLGYFALYLHPTHTYTHIYIHTHAHIHTHINTHTAQRIYPQ